MPGSLQVISAPEVCEGTFAPSFLRSLHVYSEWAKQSHSQDRAPPNRYTITHSPKTMKIHTTQAPSNTDPQDSGHKVPLNRMAHPSKFRQPIAYAQIKHTGALVIFGCNSRTHLEGRGRRRITSLKAACGSIVSFRPTRVTEQDLVSNKPNNNNKMKKGRKWGREGINR